MCGNAYKRENPTFNFLHANLGIDLRGGVEFTCALIDREGLRRNADEQTIEILRARLDERGLTEPQVSKLGNGDIQIVIPGGTRADAAATRKVLETAGQLEIGEVLKVYGTEIRGSKSTEFYSNLPEPGNKITQDESGRWVLDAAEYRGWDDVLVPARPDFRGEQPTVFLRVAKPVLNGSTSIVPIAVLTTSVIQPFTSLIRLVAVPSTSSSAPRSKRRVTPVPVPDTLPLFSTARFSWPVITVRPQFDDHRCVYRR